MNKVILNKSALGIDENDLINCTLKIAFRETKIENGRVFVEAEVIAYNKFFEATIIKKQWMPIPSEIQVKDIKCGITLE